MTETPWTETGGAAAEASLSILQTARNQAEVLDAVEQIVINLIGSEEFAIVEWVTSRGWQVLRTCGVPEAGARARLARSPEAASTVLTGRVALQEKEGAIAAIPLLGRDGVVAVVVLFRLLPQKVAIVSSDYELFDILTTYGGHALERDRHSEPK